MRVWLLSLLLSVVASVAVARNYQYSSRDAFPAIDPDATRNFTEVITSKGYPCEMHEVTTPDGYILGVFRIPYAGPSPSRKPVLLQHGLLDCSFTWILNWPEQSLAYILADAGFDVWMGNVRGNKYSRGHVSNVTNYWEYSWDQHALIDLPSTIDYILQTTGFQNLGYVGHSQGTTTMFALLSSQPDFSSKLTTFVALAPVVSVTSIRVKFLNVLAEYHIDEIISLFGIKDFLPQLPAILRVIGEDVCAEDPIICDNVIELVCGKHQGAFNNSRMPVVAGQYPGGTSTMNIMHWAQWMRTHVFERFDWGTAALNMKHYNQPTPPKYDISNYPKSLPTAIFYGGADALADPADVKILLNELPAPPVVAQLLPTYAHLDFTWAIEAYQDLYPDVVSLLSKFSSQ